VTNTRQIEALRKLQAMQSPVTIEAVPTVVERVHVTSVAGAAYLLKDDSEWSANDLRDYVMGQIEQYHGPQIRNSMKESAIFKGFLSRHGAKAVAIARFAFENQRGMWQRAPISANRFCKGSDPFFSDVIAERL
jgi:hypothetical protein